MKSSSTPRSSGRPLSIFLVGGLLCTLVYFFIRQPVSTTFQAGSVTTVGASLRSSSSPTPPPLSSSYSLEATTTNSNYTATVEKAKEKSEASRRTEPIPLSGIISSKLIDKSKLSKNHLRKGAAALQTNKFTQAQPAEVPLPQLEGGVETLSSSFSATSATAAGVLGNHLPLVNDPLYVEEYRVDLCELADTTPTIAATTTTTIETSSNDGEAEVLPQCPSHFEHRKGDADGSEKNLHQRSEWVAKQYQDYAKKCGKKKGVMWKRMPVDVHDRFNGRMMDLVFLGKAGAATASTTIVVGSSRNASASVLKEQRRQVKWLDWASGCGADLFYYHRHFQRYQADATTATELHAIGIDLVEAAVNWARGHMAEEFPTAKGADFSRLPQESIPASLSSTRGAKSNGRLDTVRFCHADGTKLQWLPINSFDVITSLGGLYHLPKKYLCSTMQQLISLLKPKTGRLLTCYVHPREMTIDLMQCRYRCGGGGGIYSSPQKVVATLIKQNEYLEGIGIPQAYTKVNASCILWERL